MVVEKKIVAIGLMELSFMILYVIYSTNLNPYNFMKLSLINMVMIPIIIQYWER